MIEEEMQDLPESSEIDPVDESYKRHIEETLTNDSSDEDDDLHDEDSGSDDSDEEKSSSDTAPTRRKLSEKQRQKSKARYNEMYRDKRYAEEKLSSTQAELDKIKSNFFELKNENVDLKNEIKNLMATLEEYKKLYESLLNSSFDSDEAEKLIDKFKNSQPISSVSKETKSAQRILTEEEIEEKLEKKLAERESFRQAKESFSESQKRWENQILRVRKEYSNSSKFDEVISTIMKEPNQAKLRQNIEFMRDIDDFPFAMEALHAASKEAGFWGMSNAKKAALVGHYHAGIKAHKTASTKSEPTITQKSSGANKNESWENTSDPAEYFAKKYLKRR